MGDEFKVGRRTNSDGAQVGAALGRDSVLISSSEVLRWKLEGKVFHVQQGDAGTKLAFGETAYDEDQPQFALRVALGTLVIPISLAVTIEDIAGTENHVIWSTTTNDIGDGTSTDLPTFNNMRPGASNPTKQGVTARSLYTGNATAATGLFEVKRWYRPFASAAATDGGKPEDYLGDILRDSWLPILYGPATLQMHCYGGTALQGFGEYVFAIFAPADMT